MKKYFSAFLTVILALFLAACGMMEDQAYGESATHASSEPEITEQETAESETADSEPKIAGSGRITGGEELSEGQREILMAFIEAYYRSLAELEVQDCSGLFTEDTVHERFRAQVDGTSWTAVTENQSQASVHEAVWAIVVGMRRVSGLDLHLLSYDFWLDCLDISRQEDGCLQVTAMEYADMRFAHTPDTESSVLGIWHSFVMKEVDGAWYLTHHAAYDSPYFHFLKWENAETGAEAGGISEEELTRLTEENIQSAAEQIELRGQQAGSEENLPETDHAYDREAAVAYAREWAGERNPQWAAYDGSGGNCINFVSQCLYASGIPMGPYGEQRWFWYSDEDRAPAWTGVSAFREYARENTGFGLDAWVGAPYDSGEEGDVILMSTDGRFHHGVIVSQVVRDEEGRTIDYLVCSNTGNYRDFPAAAYAYQEQELVRIYGWNE